MRIEKQMLIGLCGYAQAGKTSLANLLAEREGFTVASFATLLKQRIDPLFPPNTPKDVRRPLYVAYGEAMRKIQPDYWIQNITLSERTVIDDVRYLNEIRWIRLQGGIVFHVHRSNWQPANCEEDRSFQEIFASGIERTPIINNGTIEHAYTQMRDSKSFSLSLQSHAQPARVTRPLVLHEEQPIES